MAHRLIEGTSVTLRTAFLIASLLAAASALGQTAPDEPAQPSASECGPYNQPSGVDLEGQFRDQLPGTAQLAVTQVADFAGLWKALTDKFGQPPPSVLPDAGVVKSLQVVWFNDPSAPAPTPEADIYAFDAQNCYVVDVPIQTPMLPMLSPFTTPPPFVSPQPSQTAPQ